MPSCMQFLERQYSSRHGRQWSTSHGATSFCRHRPHTRFPANTIRVASRSNRHLLRQRKTAPIRDFTTVVASCHHSYSTRRHNVLRASGPLVMDAAVFDGVRDHFARGEVVTLDQLAGLFIRTMTPSAA